MAKYTRVEPAEARKGPKEGLHILSAGDIITLRYSKASLPKRISTSKRLLGAAIVTAALAITACTSATPSECVKAAEEAGLPEGVIEQLEKPGDLNAIERVALSEALKKAGLDDICDQIN